jgi:LAO/AO transport system kinase
MPNMASPSFMNSFLKGDRRAIGKAITLIESTNPKDQSLAIQLLQQLPKTKTHSYRLGISGPPGAGKSSLIEALGLYLITQGHRVAVLAIDPSSPETGGALLGDKTRMEALSRSESAFIRPSSSTKNFLGGISPHTPEIIQILEAADFDVILLETIGIGQNEVDARNVVDMLLLILPPTAGDELQGLKKGILEVIDMVIVNKGDGLLKQAAEQTAQHYQAALMSHHSANASSPTILTCSALENVGMDTIWNTIQKHYDSHQKHIFDLRHHQQQIYFDQLVQQKILQLIQQHSFFRQTKEKFGRLISKHQVSPRQASLEVIQELEKKIQNRD